MIFVLQECHLDSMPRVYAKTPKQTIISNLAPNSNLRESGTDFVPVRPLKVNLDKYTNLTLPLQKNPLFRLVFYPISRFWYHYPP